MSEHFVSTVCPCTKIALHRNYSLSFSYTATRSDRVLLIDMLCACLTMTGVVQHVLLVIAFTKVDQSSAPGNSLHNSMIC